MAVSTSENGIKVLANSEGVRLLRSIESRALDGSRVAPGAVSKVYLSLAHVSCIAKCCCVSFKLLINVDIQL